LTTTQPPSNWTKTPTKIVELLSFAERAGAGIAAADATADNRKAALEMVDSKGTATTPDLQVWDTRQAAQAYGLSVSWLNKLRVSGGGCPYIKAGRRVLYRKSDFANWVASRLRTCTSEPDARTTGHRGRAA